jgi:hypothetical protein
LIVKKWIRKKNLVFGGDLFTFSPFVGEEMVFGAEILVAGKRSRFNRIGLVSFVGFVVCFDAINKRLVMEGAEQGNGISIKEFAKKTKKNIFFGNVFSFFTIYCLIFLFN